MLDGAIVAAQEYYERCFLPNFDGFNFYAIWESPKAQYNVEKASTVIGM